MPASRPPSATPRRPDVDGLRGLAVLLVVCFHAGVAGLSGAFVAVDVFFVLSGFFLATSIIQRLAGDEDVDLRAVYARRAWRLLPAMAVVLFATLVSAVLFYAPIDRAGVADTIGPVALFIPNLTFAAEGVNYFHARHNPLLHTWTLGVEWQMALFLPLLMAGLVAVGRRRAGSETGQERRLIVLRTVFGGVFIAGAISFVIAVFVNGTSPMWAYFGPHTRLWAFCAGAMVAFIAGGGQSVFGTSEKNITIAQIIGLAAILVPAWIYDRTMPYPGAIALLPVAGTMLFLSTGGASAEALSGRLMSARPLVALGRVSYPWYLWHLPLMVLGATLAPSIGVLGRLAWGGVALVFAMLTQRLIEKPVNKKVVPRAMSGSPILYAACVSLALVLASQFVAWSSARDVRHSKHRTFAAARNDRVLHGCWAGNGGATPSRECAFGDESSRTTLALLGDSHADHWLGGLDLAGKAHGWRIEAHVMGGCPVSDFSGLTTGKTSRQYRDCNRYREAMLTHLVSQKPSAVILSSFDSYMQTGDEAFSEYQVRESAWTRGLRRTYARLSNAGIPVIVIRGTPRVPFDVPSCLSRRLARMWLSTDCTFAPDRAFMGRARRAQDIAARGLNVKFVDMMDQVCPGARCAAMRDGVVVFTDDNHLTRTFARAAAGALGERIATAAR